MCGAKQMGEPRSLGRRMSDNVPKNEDGSVDYSKDFFGKETSLTVSGQLN